MAFKDRKALAACLNNPWVGIPHALEWGLTDEQMPEGDVELREAWSDLMAAWSYVESARRRVLGMLNAPEEAR